MFTTKYWFTNMFATQKDWLNSYYLLNFKTIISGAYANWISTHSAALEHVLPLIILGLNVPETTSSATMALKDLARDCQYNIKPFSSLILDASQVQYILCFLLSF